MLDPLRAEHLEAIDRINREPEVARWWHPGEFEAWPLDDDTERFAIRVEDEIAGLIQYSEEDDPDFRHASIDLFLSARLHGSGFGGEAIRTLARHLIDERDHHRIAIDPMADNETAIRCYRSVGFRPVGTLRRYQYDHNRGEWRDNLLMDLLADELEER